MNSNIPMEKTCSRCGILQPIEEFRQRGYGRRRSECKTCARVDELARAPRNRDHRSKDLLRKYGLTLESYEMLLAMQGGCCAMCKTTNPQTRSSVFVVDHDHGCCPGAVTCGQCVRGLLCSPCNQNLGWLEKFCDMEHVLRYSNGRAPIYAYES